MTASTQEDVTFKIGFGGTTTIAGDQASTYAVTKMDQLATLNRLIASQIGGFEIALLEGDLFALTGLAEEVAEAVKEVGFVVMESPKKGGA